MARYAMVIDTKRCVGCMDCVVQCKTENDVPEGLNRDWMAEAAAEIQALLHEARQIYNV